MGLNSFPKIKLGQVKIHKNFDLTQFFGSKGTYSNALNYLLIWNCNSKFGGLIINKTVRIIVIINTNLILV